MKYLLLSIIVWGYSYGANLTVNITKLKNTNGQVLIGLFANEQEYNTKDAGIAIYVPVVDSKVTYTFHEIKDGDYAIKTFHDENNNQDLDFHFFGYPIEGYSFSNNIHPMFRGARFDEAKFKVLGDTSIEIEMIY